MDVLEEMDSTQMGGITTAQNDCQHDLARARFEFARSDRAFHCPFHDMESSLSQPSMPLELLNFLAKMAMFCTVQVSLYRPRRALGQVGWFGQERRNQIREEFQIH